MDDVLGFVLSSDTRGEAVESVAAWWPRQRALAERFAVPIDLAIAGGFLADRVGWAFGAGYQAAGRVLLTRALRTEGAGAAGAFEDRITALCATEAGGAHPKAIATTLTPRGEGDESGLVLRGRKRWATFGADAGRLLVVAKEGEDAQGRARLRLVRVELPAPGVTLRAMPPTPFAPEIIHAEVELDDVSVLASDVLAGDGYEDYVKPFRTVEDCHVHGALLGYLVRVGRHHGFAHTALEDLLGLIAAVRSLGSADPRAPGTHLALAGVLRATHDWITRSEPEWARVDGDTRARWERDRALLGIAANARTQRTERAWERVGQRSAKG